MSIQEMRNRSQGIVAKIIVGLIIIVFALFGFGSITTFLAPVPKVATVGGEDITRQEMEIAVERNRRILLSNNTAPEDIDEDQLRKQVLESLISRKLLTMASEDLGLYYGEGKLDEDILQTPAFQIDGVFDPQQFQIVIGGAGYTPLAYRQEMRRDMKFQQLAAGLQATAFLTKPEVLRISSLADQKRDIAFLRIDVDGLVDEVQVDGAETEQYYNAHINQFTTPETVDLAYLELKRSDLLDDVEVTEAELRAHYEDTKEVYGQPEARRLAHILIEVNDDVSADEARERIEEIYDRIKNGEDFAALATELSEDAGSAENGGDLGFQSRGAFVEEFEDVAFNLGVNELSAPVETEFGFHLIKVLDVEPEQVPDFEEVRSEVETDFREARAEALFVAKSSKLAEIAYESADLQTPANELGLEIKTTGHVSRDAREGIAANDRVMDVAFSPDILMDRNNSDVIEITPNHHVVVRVRDHRPSEIRPFAEVEEDVRRELALEKARDLAESRAAEIVSMLEEGSLTRYVADQFGLEWTVLPESTRNQPNIERQISDRAFSLARPPADGKSVGYTILDDGDAAVVTVTNVQNGEVADLGDQEIVSLSRALGGQLGSHDFAEFREHLVRTTEVRKL